MTPFLLCDIHLFDLHQSIIYGDETTQKICAYSSIQNIPENIINLISIYPEVETVYLKGGAQAIKCADTLNNYFSSKFNNKIKVEVIK